MNLIERAKKWMNESVELGHAEESSVCIVRDLAALDGKLCPEGSKAEPVLGTYADLAAENAELREQKAELWDSLLELQAKLERVVVDHPVKPPLKRCVCGAEAVVTTWSAGIEGDNRHSVHCRNYCGASTAKIKNPAEAKAVWQAMQSAKGKPE